MNEKYSTVTKWTIFRSTPPIRLSTGTLVVTAAAWPNFDWLSKASLSQELVH